MWIRGLIKALENCGHGQAKGRAKFGQMWSDFWPLALFVANVFGQHVRYGPVGRGPDEKIPYSQ